MTKPLGVILAGGKATRMGGGDKGRYQIAQQSLIERVITRFEPQVDAVAINANGDGSRFDDLKLPVLPDSVEGFAGPLAGVLAGMDWAADRGADLIVTAAADTPFFPTDLVQRLLAASQEMTLPLALAATQEGEKLWRHPTFGLWPVALRDDLRSNLQSGLRKVVLWTGTHRAKDVVFPSKPFDPFFNVNTPEDLKKAVQLAGGMQ